MNVPQRELTSRGGLVAPEWLKRRVRPQRGVEQVMVEPAVCDAGRVAPKAETLHEVLQRVQANFID